VKINGEALAQRMSEANVHPDFFKMMGLKPVWVDMKNNDNLYKTGDMVRFKSRKALLHFYGVSMQIPWGSARLFHELPEDHTIFGSILPITELHMWRIQDPALYENKHICGVQIGIRLPVCDFGGGSALCDCWWFHYGCFQTRFAS
jgi:hypothetical protein